MSAQHVGLLLLLTLAVPLSRVHAQEDVLESSDTIEVPEDQTTSKEESEAKGIIPANSGDVLIASGPITPTTVFPMKKPYDQAREELIKAHELWNAGHFEAASDKALEAYDDLVGLRRIPGVKRSTIRAQTRQAAEVYVEAGISYIKSYVKKQGGGPAAMEEGRSRLEDLRDVARNYPDLTRKLNAAARQLSGTPSDSPKK